MAKTNAPLLSFEGLGQIGQTLVFSRWRGVRYVRRYVVPANPNTVAQQTVRATFRFLQSMFQFLPPEAAAPWNTFATGRPFVGRNAFVSQNMQTLYDRDVPVTSLANMIGSPGARGGWAPAGADATPAATSVTIDVAAPDVPDDWAILRAEGILLADQAPSAPWVGPVLYEDDDSSTYELAFTGLENTTDYAWAVWFAYTRPDGLLAYGPSLSGVSTTTS